jgi:hypothetical protein
LHDTASSVSFASARFVKRPSIGQSTNRALATHSICLYQGLVKSTETRHGPHQNGLWAKLRSTLRSYLLLPYYSTQNSYHFELVEVSILGLLTSTSSSSSSSARPSRFCSDQPPASTVVNAAIGSIGTTTTTTPITATGGTPRQRAPMRCKTPDCDGSGSRPGRFRHCSMRCCQRRHLQIHTAAATATGGFADPRMSNWRTIIQYTRHTLVMNAIRRANTQKKTSRSEPHGLQLRTACRKTSSTSTSGTERLGEARCVSPLLVVAVELQIQLERTQHQTEI